MSGSVVPHSGQLRLDDIKTVQKAAKFCNINKSIDIIQNIEKCENTAFVKKIINLPFTAVNYFTG